jgi:Na+-translocating ferredoxin:NAD+ oxidoreductase subunit D
MEPRTPDREGFLVTTAPHLGAGDTTPRIMWTVTASLLPVVGAAVWFFGPSALLVIGACVAGAVGAEVLFVGRERIRDGSAGITGILLGLTLPAGIPLWMAFLGGVVSIGLGKLIFGGLGQNIFNPALVGRAFLQAAFPVAVTTWPEPGGSWWALRGDNFALPLMSPDPTHTVTGATPLGLMKFEGETTPLVDLVLGTTGGSLGETAGLLILLCGAYLAAKNYLNWRIPVGILATVAILSAALHSLDPVRYPDAMFALFSGGLILGAVYMATDMVTAPVTNRGAWIFALGIGLLVVIIRSWGGLPEGVMYAILFMNAFVPAINRYTQPRPFGARTTVEAAS